MQVLGQSTAKWKTPADQYMSQRTERSSKVKPPALMLVFLGMRAHFRRTCASVALAVLLAVLKECIDRLHSLALCRLLMAQ